MKYLSVCSGIEAATTAWHPMGWKPIAFSEIEKFPNAVLAHHYPDVPNLGDMTKYQEWPNASIDLLVGGTPCQSFSVAGLRKGLGDPRGNLMLTYGAIAGRYRPRWLVWENVPGVLSSNGGRDFGSFLGMLAELGYGFAYRILDAQYIRVDGFARAVPQRRRRVFVVGYLGDWRRAAAVLFERESLSGHPAPRREAREGIAPTLSARTKGGGGLGTDVECDGGLIPDWPADVSSTLDTRFGTKMGLENQHVNQGCPMFVPAAANCVTASAGAIHAPDTQTYVTSPAITASMSKGIGNNGKDECIVATAFGWQNSASQGDSVSNETLPTLDSGQVAVAHAIRTAQTGSNGWGVDPNTAYTLDQAQGQAVQAGMAVRRLTPTECERLQGFPDGYADIRHGGKATPDGPRYKAIGNSMAVNVMKWLGQRIDQVDKL